MSRQSDPIKPNLSSIGNPTGMLRLKKVRYRQLNSRQKENYNFAKISAVLADYGFITLRLTDDWQGADFIAQHIDGETLLRIQLKSRCGFFGKYMNKGIHIVFSDAGRWYLFPHDTVFQIVDRSSRIGSTASWKNRGEYHFPRLSKHLRAVLAPYQLEV